MAPQAFQKISRGVGVPSVLGVTGGFRCVPEGFRSVPEAFQGIYQPQRLNGI